MYVNKKNKKKLKKVVDIIYSNDYYVYINETAKGGHHVKFVSCATAGRRPGLDGPAAPARVRPPARARARVPELQAQPDAGV